MELSAFVRFLESRKGLLDGVCVSGGEPTLCPELESLLRSIKALGYSVKLDTNGSRPAVLKRLVGEGLVDYVAMDVKNCPSRYAETVGLEKADLQAVEESLRFLLSGQVAYELRTTVVQQLHSAAATEEMGKWVAGLVPGAKPRKWFLQRFTDRSTVAFAGLSAPAEEELLSWRELLSAYAEQAAIRGE
jgi:anaerobic ribonucleoside-triphosphate reductase activating protein